MFELCIRKITKPPVTRLILIPRNRIPKLLGKAVVSLPIPLRRWREATPKPIAPPKLTRTADRWSLMADRTPLIFLTESTVFLSGTMTLDLMHEGLTLRRDEIRMNSTGSLVPGNNLIGNRPHDMQLSTASVTNST